MIEIKNISKSFGDTIALSDISVSINDSELFGFIGPDGAGKTTLFRLLTTLLVQDSGTITLMGYDSVKDYREIRKHVGYMPGRFSLYQDLTVEENLNFYATVFGTTVSENYHLIRDIYSHIEPFKKRPAGKLSGGMKQKLALCCALIHAPRIIILDEPTTGVDAVSRTEFWEMLKNLKKENITIVVSTPYMDEASRCDRVSLIQAGKIMVTDKPAELAVASGMRIFAVSSAHKFQLIRLLRSNSSVSSVDAFGDSAHITFRDNMPHPEIVAYLRDEGLGDTSIREIEPGIEDTFLQLMKKTEI
jgi:ABC-2 type transport system ATP-binding protein